MEHPRLLDAVFASLGNGSREGSGPAEDMWGEGRLRRWAQLMDSHETAQGVVFNMALNCSR